MAYLISIIFIIVYGFGLFYWNKKINWRLSKKISKPLKLLHYSGFTICLIIAVLYSNYDLTLRGIWTSRIIILFTLFTGIFFIFVANKSSIIEIEKWYFKFFSFLPILTAAILLIPFLGIVIVLSLFGQLTNPVTKIYFEDDNLRVQSTFVGVLGPPKIDIFEKNLIFEKHLKRTDYWANEIDSIKVSYDKDSTRIFIYGLYKYDEERKGDTEIICLKN